MGATCLNGKELDSNEKAAKDSENNIEEFKQESDRDITALDLEMEFEKISTKLPLALDVIYGERTSRCWPESCPCGSDLDLASFASLLNSTKNFGWHSTDSGEYKGSFSLNMLDKRLSLSNCPLNLRLSEFIFEDLIHQRKPRSLNDPGGFLSDSSVMDNIGNVVLSHSGWWKLDAFQENAKAISLLKRSIFTHLSILDDVINQHGSRSPRTLELSRSSVLVDNNTSLQKSRTELTPVGKEASEVKFSKMKLISCSSSKSAFSWQSISSANTSITRGQLQCFQKSGMSCFIFSLDEAPQVLYMASPLKIESSAEKAIDGMYLFYFKDDKNSESREHSMNSTSLIGKMKVSSSIILTPNRVKIMETEFVLYGSQGELSNKLQKSSSIVSGTKGFTRKVAEIFRTSNMAKIKPKDKVHEQQKLDGLGDISESSPANDAFDVLLPNLELAAIVVRECFQDTMNDLMCGGWGLKFLEKAGHKNTSPEPSLPPPCSSKIPANKDESARSLNVILPADLHGGPATRHGGPASIISRWRSGGHCDCGGWDIGCPLTVLNQSSIFSNASSKDTEKKPVNLFIEGTKNTEHPTLSMMKMTEGLYSIYFHSSLSILQSFSIAVASIHQTR